MPIYDDHMVQNAVYVLWNWVELPSSEFESESNCHHRNWNWIAVGIWNRSGIAFIGIGIELRKRNWPLQPCYVRRLSWRYGVGNALQQRLVRQHGAVVLWRLQGGSDSGEWNSGRRGGVAILGIINSILIVLIWSLINVYTFIFFFFSAGFQTLDHSRWTCVLIPSPPPCPP